jgi:hypothetical protein
MTDEYSNGHVHLVDEDPVVIDLRKRIDQVKQEQQSLRERLAEVNDVVSRYERAVRALTGEKAPTPTPRTPGKRVREHPSGVGEERLDRIREIVLEYAADHEEFRQVDIRTQPGLEGAMVTSSVMTTAFNRLRQENVIRLARQEGNSKWFRLTREALNAQ